MSNKIQQMRAWKFLMEELQKIQDKDLKKAVIAEFRERALRDWGWDPATGNLAEPRTPELDEWEKDFVERVQLAQQLGVFIPDPALDAETRAEMRKFIRNGGTLLDIPENLRTPVIIDLFYAVLHEEGEELLGLADYFIKTHKKGQENDNETHQ